MSHLIDATYLILQEELNSSNDLLNSSSSSSSSASSSTSLSSSSSSTFSTEDQHEYNLFKRKYIVHHIPRYSNFDFKSHFRMGKVLFEQCLKRIAPIYAKKTCIGRPITPANNSLLMTIWYLANLETYRQIGDRFELDRGLRRRVILVMVKSIYSLRSEFIIWPTGEAISNLNVRFNVLRGCNSFPGVVGCVDGTHIYIPGPKGDDSYYNRKGTHSMQLQAVCDSQMIFLDAYFRWPGSAHDARIWKSSELYKKLSTQKILPEELHLLGDRAYPLDMYIMTPYKDNGHLGNEEHKFINLLSKTRVIIEQAFGRLKGSYRRLKFLEIINLCNAKYYVLTCVIMHNFILQSGEIIETLAEDLDDEYEDDFDEIISTSTNLLAINKTSDLMSIISNT